MHRKQQKQVSIFRRLRSTPVLIVVSLVVVASTLTHGFGVFAAVCNSTTDCQNQINSLSAANAAAQDSLNGLRATAASYQDAINQLQSQINGLQAQIVANQAQQASLQQQIIQKQLEIDEQKKVLGNDLKAMYLSGQMTPEEMLATSNSISDYIDKQQQYSAVQDKIQDTLKQIADLQAKLQSEKAQVEALLKAQQTQEAQLANSQAQQQSLLNYNVDQQNQFSAQISANKAAIAAAQRQQFLFNVSLYGAAAYGGSGGYPWANAVQVGGTYNWSYNGGLYDPLGWNYRNCTSYAFWRLGQARGILLPWSNFPTVYNSGGRIGYSIPDFQNLGYRVDHDPDGATLAVSGAGPYGNGSYGHIMYVEASDASSAYVSQYNYAGDGRFSTMTIHSSWQTWFVHIP